MSPPKAPCAYCTTEHTPHFWRSVDRGFGPEFCCSVPCMRRLATLPYTNLLLQSHWDLDEITE